MLGHVKGEWRSEVKGRLSGGVAIELRSRVAGKLESYDVG